MMHDEVVSRLRHILTEGEIAPGARIPERELCASLAISRTLIGWPTDLACRLKTSGTLLRTCDSALPRTLSARDTSVSTRHAEREPARSSARLCAIASCAVTRDQS